MHFQHKIKSINHDFAVGEGGIGGRGREHLYGAAVARNARADVDDLTSLSLSSLSPLSFSLLSLSLSFSLLAGKIQGDRESKGGGEGNQPYGASSAAAAGNEGRDFFSGISQPSPFFARSFFLEEKEEGGRQIVENSDFLCCALVRRPPKKLIKNLFSSPACCPTCVYNILHTSVPQGAENPDTFHEDDARRRVSGCTGKIKVKIF